LTATVQVEEEATKWVPAIQDEVPEWIPVDEPEEKPVVQRAPVVKRQISE